MRRPNQRVFPVVITEAEGEDEQCAAIIDPGRRKAPRDRVVTIRWILAGRDLEWDHSGGGRAPDNAAIAMNQGEKQGPVWPCEELPIRQDPFYELTVTEEHLGCMDEGVPYPYTVYLLVDGTPCAIDPEVEYDD